MAKVKPLNDRQIKTAAAQEKEYKLADGDGLYLHIKPNGSKLWRFRYMLNGKLAMMSLGKYPDVTIADARKKRSSLRELVASGESPIAKKRERKGMTFSDLADEYFNHRVDLKDTYIRDNKAYLKNHWYPILENMILDTIEAIHIIRCIERIEKHGAVTIAKKTGSLIDRIFRYGVTKQYMKYNPMRDIDLSVIVKPHTPKNYAHITDENILKHLLKDMENYVGDIVTRTALRLMPYVFVRPSEIRGMLWSEIDFKKKIWFIPAERMKMKRDHIVPLTESMINIINVMKDNGSDFVFPSPQTTVRQLSENTLNVGLKRLGYEGIMTSHGFRHTASTFLHENMHVHGVHSDAIEIQMAHVEKNNVKGVYNKAIYIEERIRLMKWWSDYLDALKASKQ